MLRRVLVIAALVAATTLALPGSPAQARFCQIDYYCYLTFYSDSSHTSVVGEQYTNCVGDVSMWGVRSGYQEFVETPC